MCTTAGISIWLQHQHWLLYTHARVLHVFLANFVLTHSCPSCFSPSLVAPLASAYHVPLAAAPPLAAQAHTHAHTISSRRHREQSAKSVNGASEEANSCDASTQIRVPPWHLQNAKTCVPLTPPLFSILAVNRPKAPPAKPPMAPLKALLIKQLFMKSSCTIRMGCAVNASTRHNFCMDPVIRCKSVKVKESVEEETRNEH
jgi:hypothetical protein